MAKKFRMEATPAERKVWDIVRAHRLFGLKFKRQFPYRGFILDFFCRELGLALEVDGDVHLDPERMEYDAARQQLIEACGLRIIRIRNEEVSRTNVERMIRPLIASPLPSYEGRGPGGEEKSEGRGPGGEEKSEGRGPGGEEKSEATDLEESARARGAQNQNAERAPMLGALSA